MTITLTNEQKLNSQIKQCQSIDELRNLMPSLVAQYKKIAPYAFVNDAIILDAQSELYATIDNFDTADIEDTKINEVINKEVHKAVAHKEDAPAKIDLVLEPEFNTINALLGEISSTLDSIDSACQIKVKKVSTQVNHKCSSRPFRKEEQLELCF